MPLGRPVLMDVGQPDLWMVPENLALGNKRATGTKLLCVLNKIIGINIEIAFQKITLKK